MLVKKTSLAKATIETDKLINNINELKKQIKNETFFMAVVKADAYGHGAIPLAQVMEEAKVVDYFGVAQLQEALELRETEIKTPILIFNSLRIDEIDLAIQKEITMTVFSKDIAEKIVIRAGKLNKKAIVHLKIDTGMARLGVSSFEEAFELYQLLDSDFVHIEGIYTHFADANQLSPNPFTQKQFARFQDILEQFNIHDIRFELAHSCNTAATLNFPDYHLDMVRVGIGLHGFNPTTGNEKELSLSPIQKLDAMVTHVKDIPAGKNVGYNRTYFSTENMRIATIAIGYADGVALSLSNKASFTYKGTKLPIIGQICMDQIMLDCSVVPDLAVGDYVNYFGDPAENYSSIVDLANAALSTEYEMLCRIGNRVERIYE